MTKDGKDQAASSEASSPEDAFALLGNEIRAEIFKVMANGGEIPFSELRSQMDQNLSPSQLHYHLQQLVGSLVQKTDDGYELRPEGYRINRTLKSVTLPHPGEYMAVDTGFECYFCQVPVDAMFEGGWAIIQCPDCEYRYLHDAVLVSFEPFADETAAFEHLSRFTQHKILAYARDICPHCGNTVDSELLTPDHLPLEKDQHRRVAAHLRCDYCEVTGEMTLGMALLANQELRSFCTEHGVDIFTTPYWDLEFAATDEHLTVRSTDPWEIALEVTFDDDTLELVVDGDLNVIERNRLNATGDGHSSLLGGIRSGARITGSGGRGEMVILPDNADCLEYLRHHRWSDGVTCPRCERQDTIKKGTTGKDAKRYRCQHCGGTFNDLTGTIFADHRLTLAEMFHIIRQMDETTTVEIARQLDRSSESVADFVREVRDAREADTVFGR